MKVRQNLTKHRTTTVNHQTGEVTSDTTELAEVIPIRSTVLEEPPFVKMYLDDLSNMVGLPRSLHPLLFKLVEKIDYNGEISISSRFRENLCDALKISRQTLRNRINLLTKHGIMVSLGGSDYVVNPKYFARGKWREIIQQRKDFELKIKYKADGTKEVTTKGSQDKGQQPLL